MNFDKREAGTGGKIRETFSAAGTKPTPREIARAVAQKTQRTWSFRYGQSKIDPAR